MATLPTLTRTIDDDFVNTWYEIRSEVIDNILEATVVTLALKEHGCMVPQVGGEYITRTVGYAKPSTQRFTKGSVLTQTVVKLDTMARWDWAYFLVDVNRSLVDDAKNAGKFKIKDYVARRLEAARNAVVQDLEKYVCQWGGAYNAPVQINGLYDVNPLYTAEAAATAPFSDTDNASDSQASGTSNGNIDRSANAWWRNWVAYNDATAADATFIAGPTNEPYALNLLPDMRHMFNKISANQESPNFILMDQSIFEAYEDEVADKQQIVRTSFDKKAADLGFDTLTFKGATMAYTSKLAGTLHVHMLNMNHLEFVYDPEVWFDMTNWKETSNQLERVAYIVCMAAGLITAQPRRHGVMEYAS